MDRARKSVYLKIDKIVAARNWWGGENGELLLHGYKVSVWNFEKVLEIDSGDGCTMM